MRKIYSILLLFCCILIVACGEQEHFSSSEMRYADLLRIHSGEQWTEVAVLDAWHPGKILHTYILVPRDEELPDNLPEGTIVRTPLERAVVFSSVHASLFCDLKCAERMVGMCDVSYVLSDSLRRLLSEGLLLDLGSSMRIDAERIIAAGPDAFFVSPFENAGYGVLENMNVPLIECADYMETTALGRAEWMKFYGLLMGAADEADSLFSEVEKDYQNICERVVQTAERPTLICDLKQGSAWYVPGGESYIGNLFLDAGADYLFADQKESGSVALAFERIFAKGRNADYWVVKYGGSAALTYQMLQEDNPLYAHFSPWKEHKIFGCNTYAVPYYEETPFHPNLLLRDMVKIFHPELLPDYQLRYYSPLSK